MNMRTIMCTTVSPQYNDVYEINYDFLYSLRNIMDYVVRGDEWALDDYYEALDIRNDDLRWVLSDGQYRRFLGADYFYRPIYVTGGRWNFRIYINYPNRSLFYFGVPYHYRTTSGMMISFTSVIISARSCLLIRFIVSGRSRRSAWSRWSAWTRRAFSCRGSA